MTMWPLYIGLVRSVHLVGMGRASAVSISLLYMIPKPEIAAAYHSGAVAGSFIGHPLNMAVMFPSSLALVTLWGSSKPVAFRASSK